VQAPNLFTTIVYYGILLGLVTGWLLLPRLRVLKVAIVSVASISWLAFFWSQRSAQHLTVLSPPSGYSIFFKGGHSGDLLIDSGTTNAVQAVVKPYLRAQGINRLRTMVLSVGHVNQTAGAAMLADLFKVREVLTSGVKYQSSSYRAILEELDDRPLVVKTVEPGNGVGPWEVIYPEESEPFSSADDKPLVLWGRIRQTSVLITSSLSSNGQDNLIERYPGMDADILISGLPGRAEPATDRFLAAIHPKLVIICDSRYPARAQASARLRARLGRVSVPVIYTSKEGSTTIGRAAESAPDRAAGGSSGSSQSSSWQRWRGR
jgi:competence protein ComEC